MNYTDGYYKMNINELSLDPNNPRHDPVNDDMLALKALMNTKNYDNKIVTLMKDILEYGQNPIDIIGVLVTEKNTLYSKEGNRRVSAFKIMNNPSLIKESNPKLYDRVTNLLKVYKAPSPEVMCFITHNQSILDHAVELKHQGEQSGAGTVTWGSKEKARHKRNKGIHDPIHAFLNTLESKGILSSQKRENITKTNWERILTQDGQKWLGVLKKEGSFEIIGDIKAFSEKFKLVTDAIENETHHIITNITTRKELFDNLDKLLIESVETAEANDNDNLDMADSDRTTEIESYETLKVNTDVDANNKISEKSEEPSKDNSKNESRDEKAEPSKFRLQELYVSDNSRIPKEQHTAFLNIKKELTKLSGGNGGFYKTYKLSTYYLIRALIEQCLKYWLSIYHDSLYRQCLNNNDASLGKMINKINIKIDNKTDIFFDETINKRFQTFFASRGTKDLLDTLIHHPYLLSDDINVLHNFTSGFLFEILNHILTYSDIQ